MKAALYLRCSTTKQDLESQRHMLMEWVRGNPCDYQFYEDYAMSGKSTERQGVLALLEAARKKEFDLVVVSELSRVGRSIGFIHNTIEELNKLGIKVVLANSGAVLDYSTLEGRALIGGLALAADIEWMLIQERNARGRDKIAREHIPVGRKKKLVSLEAIRALQEKGRSLRQIAVELNSSAATISRRLKDVPKVGISGALRNPVVMEPKVQET